ncbi:MAG: hypothetical protein U9Q71_03690 [Pseudomonadota bacterium]|nr:hypothetical protein [Pseudomonadota bacterium]
MFIRRTKTRTTDSGAQSYSYRLVDTYRVAGRVRQRTLLKLGSGFTFPRRQWPELTQRIEQIIVGQHQLLPLPPEVEHEAQNIAALLTSKYAGSELLLDPKKGAGGARKTPDRPDGASNHPQQPEDERSRAEKPFWPIFQLILVK